MSVIDDHIAQIRRIWRYHMVDETNGVCDFAVVLGSADLAVPKHAASEMQRRGIPLAICSGGLGKVTEEIWHETEASRFKDVMVREGIPPDSILLEQHAKNTGENILNSIAIIRESYPDMRSALIVCKPYMRRRALATAEAQASEFSWSVTSERLEFDEYLDREPDSKLCVDLMVGDLQRIIVYPREGFQSPQHVPPEVMADLKALIDVGFDKFVIRDEDGQPRF